MKTKTVGIVIPIYNVEKYLRQCLDSVVNQTYKNLQIILVNDGSTDKNSLNIAKEYTLKDKRIILFDKENRGLSTARNVGIEYFSGVYKFKNIDTKIKDNSLIEFIIEGDNPYNIYKIYKSYKAFNNEKELQTFAYPIIDYIIFLDSDDYWQLDCIEQCVPKMNGVEIVWLNHYYYYDDIEKPEVIPLTIIESYGYKKSQKINIEYFLKRILNMKIESLWFGWHGMIDFSYLKQIKLKFLDGILHEDHYFGKLLFFQSKNIFIFLKKLIYYRIRRNSIMNYKNERSYIPNYTMKYYNMLEKDYFLYKKFHRNSSLFVTAMLVFGFIKKQSNLNNIHLMEEIFSSKLKNWRNELINFDEKYLENILYESFVSLFKLSKDIKLNLALLSNFFFEIILIKNNIIRNQISQIHILDGKIQLNNKIIQDKQKQIDILHQEISQTKNLLFFQAKYGTAKQRIQNQLSYRLGKILIVNSKSIFGILFMPIYIIATIICYHQDQKIYKEKIRKDSSLKLPHLEVYTDYAIALKEKECLTYKLGQSLIKANKTWYKGGYIKFLFEIWKLKKRKK